jgi:hypothetical protein
MHSRLSKDRSILKNRPPVHSQVKLESLVRDNRIDFRGTRPPTPAILGFDEIRDAEDFDAMSS